MTLPEAADDDIAAPPGAPPVPTEPVLDPDDPKTQLLNRLKDLLRGLPAYFEFSNVISGVNATDLFALNTLLGTSIESQVVRALNQQRKLWDPDDEWLGFVFERQAQTFPDVRLVRKAAGEALEIALGIELKGWFLLSKEGEPSFRFTPTPAACADHDLLVVVPWYLDNVLSGTPVAAEPWVASSKWAAEYRNYYWQHMRMTKGDTGIIAPAGAHPYPQKDTLTSDHAVSDGGGNFGRVARVKGLMTQWVQLSNDLEVLGIRIGDWRRFLQLHSDNADLDAITLHLFDQVADQVANDSAERAGRILVAMREIADALSSE